jgi:hypothetical protein
MAEEQRCCQWVLPKPARQPFADPAAAGVTRQLHRPVRPTTHALAFLALIVAHERPHKPFSDPGFGRVEAPAERTAPPADRVRDDLRGGKLGD